MLIEKTIKTSFKSTHSITSHVSDIVFNSKIKEGLCLITVPHTTASLVITSFWDPLGLCDLMDEIDRNIPARVTYFHQDSPYDASGHVKSALIGSKNMLLVKDGDLILGSSQGLVLMEFDGPRERRFAVQIIEKPLILSKHELTTEYMGMHDITDEVIKAVTDSKVRNGVCHISMLHSTAGIVVSEKSLKSKLDIMEDFERMVPTRADFKHRETASDAAGHVKTALTDSRISIIIDNGALLIGEDQRVLFAEFDGPRKRSYMIGIFE